jgi:WD40 repeat protein
MPATPGCPDRQTLFQLALGHMPPAKVESLAGHVEQCEHCISSLEGLKGQDTLIEAMSAQGTVEEEPSQAVDKLIKQFRGVSLSRTQFGEPIPPATGSAPEVTQEFLTFLSPPEGPGELGRLGGYRVLSVLGSGGMGLVFRAEDTRLQREVALKVMRPELTARPDFHSRFQREARAAAAVKHDHIATVYQVGEDRGTSFLAMELLEGESLAARLAREPRLPVAEVLRIGHQAACGLAAAHEKGLIHRDIKPANLWLEREPRTSAHGEPGASATGGRVKILDFGLAKLEGAEVQATQSGRVMGTPCYMAPEQARGEKSDARADLFSLGCVLYKAATGQVPFKGEQTLSVLWSLANERPQSARAINPQVPAALSDLIDRLLAKQPAGRPASAQAVAEALAAIGRPQPQPPSRASRRRRMALAAALAGVAALAAVIVVIIRDREGRELARVEVPEGGSVEVKGSATSKEKKQPAAKDKTKVKAPGLPVLSPGEPLSPTALVQQPAKLPGVRSWTIETRDVWSPLQVAYRPDGKRLAVGSQEGTIRVWETQTGRLVQVLFGPCMTTSLAWSPDGRVLAVATGYLPFWKTSIELWDAETGRLVRTLTLPFEGGVPALAWSADGQSVLAASYRCLAWNAKDGKLLRSFPAAYATAAAFSPDGKLLAGIQAAGGITVWDTETGKEIALVKAPATTLLSVAWSQDGKRLAADEEKGLHVWDVPSGKECFWHKEIRVPYYSWIALSPDGRTLLYNQASNAGVGAVEVKTDAKPRRLEDSGPSVLAWSPDGKTIARGIRNNDNSVRLYDAATGQRLRSLSEGDTHFGALAWSPDGSTVATTDNLLRTVLSAMDTGEAHADLKEATLPLAWSPVGKRLATGGPNHAVILWESGGKVRVRLTGHQAPVTGLAWSPDGKRLASCAAGEKRVLLWDTAKDERLRELGPFAGGAESVTWSRDGRLLAFNVPEIGWHVWDVEQNKQANDPKQWRNLLHFVFAPDSRTALVSSGLYDSYRLRTLATGKERRVPVFFTYLPPLWSPDGRLVAISKGAGIELWRGDLRGRLRTLPEVGGAVAAQIAFSSDGKLVAAVVGRRLRVWETDTGRLRGVLFAGHHGLTISQEGHYTGSDEVERGIVMVVQKDDGTQEVLEPADFEQKYGFRNDPDKVHFLQPLPPPPYPLPGQPMGPHALVREPAELPDSRVASWTIETRSTREQVRAMAYRPDGKLLATGGGDGTIRLWDPATGELVRILLGEPVLSLSWSVDGKVLAAGSEDTTRLWEADTGRLLRRIPAGRIVAWSPLGSILAQLRGHELGLWDATKEQYLHTIQVAGQGQALAWSPDGKTIAVGIDDKSARLWDVASGKETHKLEGHDGTHVRGIAWSPDSKRLVTVAQGGGGRGFYVWDAATGKLQQQFAVEAPVDLMMFPTVAWSPDGKAVVLGRNGGFFGLFDADSGRQIRALDAGGDVFALAWSPDGKQVATATLQGVRLYEPATGKQTHALEEGNRQRWLTSLALSPDRQRLAVGFSTGALLAIVETATGRRAPTPAQVGGIAAWGPDGKLLAATAIDSTVRLWDAATAQPVRTLEGQVFFNFPFPIAWSADGKMVAAGGGQRLWVWSAESGKLLWQNDRHQHVFGIAWSPDGSRLATTDDGDKGEVRVWEAQSGKQLQTQPWRSAALAWSPDGKTLAAAPAGGNRCHLIDAATGAMRVRGKDEPGWGVMAIRWSPDGKTFETFHGSGPWLVLHSWDAATGKQLRSIPITWPPTFPYISHSAWSRDGRVLALTTGCQVNLFDSDGHAFGVLLPGEPFAHLAVRADGHYRGSARIERQIMFVVQKRDGTSETLTPAEFEQRYGWKNDPAKVRLID